MLPIVRVRVVHSKDWREMMGGVSVELWEQEEEESRLKTNWELSAAYERWQVVGELLLWRGCWSWATVGKCRNGDLDVWWGLREWDNWGRQERMGFSMNGGLLVFFFLFSPLDSRDISSVLTGDRQRFLYCSRIRWEDIPSHNFYFLNKIWRIVINWVLRAGMGAFNKMRKICGDKSIKVTLGNRNLNWYGGISCYLLYAKWNSSDWLRDFFSPSWVLWPNIVIFFADIKVNDLGLDLLHCKYNIPLVQVF